MLRRVIRSLAVLSCAGTCAALGTGPAAAGTPTHLAVSCTGSTATSVSATGVTVKGSATCTGPVNASLATTYTVAGVRATVTTVVPLVSGATQVNVTVPVVGVSAACSVLTNVATGATIATSCSV
ncbi:hypothetical protein GCM10010168_26170 [Actinoplanes ianthinogenes]|uniref:Uncharacterized protein n=1 Tax=Actinoplanes ianthinogenes TaxID=122358 RepID=A0ABM7M9F6_9ACTN|nr:hypothetical protein [Actinoplanes ianthinogenes]BCJ48257.1 hypothetical protein Aiant_89140 [Actinoplanes ianthinogenes]GGR07484.1 hypothetical protein GCM10010168_26170 [Actinoplanes ianthinogenes]